MPSYYPQSVIYEEKKVTYWILGFTLVLFSILFFLYYLYERNKLGVFIALPLVGIFTLFIQLFLYYLYFLSHFFHSFFAYYN